MKKIKLLATFVLMIITMTTFTIISRATTGTVNEDAIKLRKEPDETSTILDLLNEGDEVEILEFEDGWYKVKATTGLGKVKGYVSEEALDVENDLTPEPDETVPVVSTPVVIEEVEENKEYTIQQEVSIKVLPLIYSREKAKISGNIRVIEIINNWCRIESDVEIGWIRINSLKKAISIVTQEVTQQETEVEEPIQEPQEQPEETPVEEEEEEELQETPLNKVGYVTPEGLRVRKGPSTDTEAITSLSKNDEVKIIAQVGNWYKIEYKGQIGYVSAKYISDTKVYDTTSRGGSTLEAPTEEVQQESTPTVEETPIETTPSPEPIPETSTKGAEIVEFAKKYLGYKYVSGGASPSTGFDCSGFTQYVYKQFGISLYRSSHDQIKNGVAVNKSDLQLGDLVIFNNEANTAIGHVGIYIGDGNFIHAANSNDGVKITSLSLSYYKVRYVGARRVI